MATVTSLGFTIFSKYSGAGVRDAHRSINSLDERMKLANKTFVAAAARTSMLQTAAVALAPAVTTVGVALAGAAGGAAAMGAAAGAAAGVFGIAMGAMIKKTLEMREAGEKLSPMQQVFVRNVDQMKAAWDKFLLSTQDKTLTVAGDFVAGLRDGIGKLNPLIDATYPAIKKASQAWQDWMRGEGLDRFIGVLTKQGVPALESMLSAGRHLMTFLGNGFRDFLPLGVSIAETLNRGAASLAKWSNEGGFQRFVDRVMQHAPGVKDFFNALLAALSRVSSALATLGPIALSVATFLLEMLAAMPPWAIEAFFLAFVGFKILFGVTAAISAVTTAMHLLNLAFIATPVGWIVLAIGAVVAAIVLIATKTTWFQDLWAAAWPKIKMAAEAVWTWLKQTWEKLWPALKAVWDAVWPPILEAFQKVWPELVKAAKIAWDWLQDAWKALLVAIPEAWKWFSDNFGGLFKGVWEMFGSFALAAWDILKAAWKVLWGAIETTFLAFAAIFTGDWDKVWSSLKDWFGKVWDLIVSIFRVVITEVFPAVLRAGWELLKVIWAGLWGAITGVATAIWDGIVGLWNDFWSSIKEEATSWLNALKSVWDTVWGALSAAFDAVMSVVKWAWENVLRPVFDAIGTAAKFLGTLIVTVLVAPFVIAWNILSAAAELAWNNVLKPVFDGIAAVAQWLWSSIIKPVFDGVRNTIVGAFTAVWNYISPWVEMFKTLFQIGLTFITNLWNTVWDAVVNFFGGIWVKVRTTVELWWATMQFYWEMGLAYVKGIWDSVWGAVVDFFGGIWVNIRTTAETWWATIRYYWELGLAYVKLIWDTAWNAISGFVKGVWDGIVNAATNLWDRIKGFFQAGSDWLLSTFWDPVKKFFTETIPNAFTFAVDVLGKAWDSIKKVVRDPIQAVVDIVYNKGIVAVWNKVAKTFGASELGTFELPQFATGGPVRGPGTATSDSIMARLSNNEHVWTAREVAAAGGHGAVAALRSAVMGGKAVRTFGTTSFAEGGGVLGTIGSALSSVGSFISSGLESLGNLALGAIHPVLSRLIDGVVGTGITAVRNIVPGDNPPLEQFGVGLINKMATTVKDWVKAKDVAPAAGAPWNGTIAPGALGRMQEWALSQRGGRYLWGGVGSGAMDCSGMVGNLWAIATGNPLYRRYFTTHTMRAGNYGFQNGPGGFTVYVTDKNVGHTAANVGGLHVEAYGGDGTPFAIGGGGTPYSYFDRVLHLPGLARGGGVDLDALRSPRKGFLSHMMTGWPELNPKRYGLGTHGARSGWHLTGDRGPEWVNFRGGEKVLPSGDLPPMRGAGGGDHYEFHIDARGATAEAVQMLNRDTVPQLRMMLHQGVGKNKGR